MARIGGNGFARGGGPQSGHRFARFRVENGCGGKGLAAAVAHLRMWYETTRQGAPGTTMGGRWVGLLFLLRYFYFWKFSLNRGNNGGVLRLSRAPRQSISCVSGISDRIFSGTFFHEVRFRKFFSRSSS